MFLGQYRHNIDEKGRLTIPVRYREMLAEGAYVTQGFEKNLMVLTAPTFQAISKRVNQMSLTESTARELRRLLFSTASYIDPDKNGRILLPQFLRELSELRNEVVLVGVGDYFEIWPDDSWDAQYEKLKDTEANAQRFKGLSLAPEQT
ncbi:MAG: division/cell wall cluster transcriptional repressor MraZ [Chloroflexi bacterium]|jgi:MraZ protein|nr:division/cell wall cluster transcriptional repressor MraZ [Chloroflexota bacterium]MBT3670730.1 division/cell wall cluster transcriptional repressor MraZ [Chloroflexota bacterium]MBT4003879.1 division/cell wall cluster transcriptional repressor MraZ [Chloroflexota bacterium]MBT4305099.1 division/cell wall cluster transcriptional repressor MraZ [Chloroflexota bacterium]MBT4533380.1 division/cell wall cluster transcriptional repressor MraZ [Chloroflexota bacterium]